MISKYDWYAELGNRPQFYGKPQKKIIQTAGFPLDHRIGHGNGLVTSFEWPSLD